MAEFPLTPYAGTSGWSGSTASQDRALLEDSNGVTSMRQQTALSAVWDAREHGLTWRELADGMGWHHGQASAALSVLHQTGKVCRLTDRRQRCSIYVAPKYVADRATAKYGTRSTRLVRLIAELRTLHHPRDGRCVQCNQLMPCLTLSALVGYDH